MQAVLLPQQFPMHFARLGPSSVLVVSLDRVDRCAIAVQAGGKAQELAIMGAWAGQYMKERMGWGLLSVFFFRPKAIWYH